LIYFLKLVYLMYIKCTNSMENNRNFQVFMNKSFYSKVRKNELEEVFDNFF